MKTLSIIVGALFFIVTAIFTWCAIRINKGEDEKWKKKK